MKRFWLILLSLGLVMAFSASAFAVDVKFSGSYYAGGLYLSKTKAAADDGDGMSTAFYFQRLRLQTDFVVSPGLVFVARFDALERAWGAARSAAGTAADSLSSGTRAENENIAFDMAYVAYTSPVGLFRVGIQPGGGWGTVFGDSVGPRNRLVYISPNLGGFTFLAVHETFVEGGKTAINPTSTTADSDFEDVQAAFMYVTQNINVGFAYAYLMNSSTRTAVPVGYKGKYHLFIPYVKATFGPVAIQAEIDYYYSNKFREYDGPGTALTKISSLAGWVNAVGTFGPVYVGGTFAYSQGQKDQDFTRDTANQALGGGTDWSPTLIMFNYDLTYWEGGIAGITNPFLNAWLYQGNVGVKPIAALDIGASLTYATRDTVAPSFDKKLGWEADITATYKITNNLSYMLGVGYLLTGDNFKGAHAAGDTRNDYLVINKLTLTF